MAVTIIANASSSFSSRGAYPPSSPTPVTGILFSFNTDFRVWNTSAERRNASLHVGAETGMIINSWMSTLLVACAPPLSIFIIGTGSTRASSPPIYRYNETPFAIAAAFAQASDVPRIAFAPRRLLFAVPSSSIIRRSISSCSNTFLPASTFAISPFTAATALVTPLPR